MIDVHDLSPGDRVVLNCPKSRIMPKRQAEFRALARNLSELPDGDLVSRPGRLFLESAAEWAVFLLGEVEGARLLGLFAVDSDGGLREEEGRRIFIERRVFVGRG
jgi:hypothetical protein